MSKAMKRLYWLVALPAIIGCNAGTAKTDGDTETGNRHQPARHLVEIAQMKFNPSVLKANEGDSIVFVNRDIVVHDVTEEKDKAWSSQALSPGAAWVLIADKTVSYYCSIHPVMKGEIIVD